MSKKISVALIFPSSPKEGEVNLGFNRIFKWINSNHRFVCDRFFYEKGNVINYDSKKDLNQYHIIAFSISFFNDYLKVPLIIQKSNLKLFASDRQESFPLIIGGGNALTLNPEPVAEIFDAIVVGDAEPVMDFLLDTLSSFKGEKKARILEKLNESSHIYVPLMKKQVKIAVSELKHTPSFSRHGGSKLAIKNAGLVEIGRGCRWKCRFCPIGYVYLPARYYPIENVLQAVDEIREKKIGLIAPVITDHPEIEKILGEILKSGKKVTVSSLRIKETETSFLSLLEHSQKTITIAPETGSERLRRKINKPILEKDIIKLIDSIPDGINKVRCYIMLGIPGETFEDIKDTMTMLEEIKLILARKGIEMEVNVNPFIPVPHTPFQWYNMESKKTLTTKLTLLQKKLAMSGIKLNVKSYREAKREEVIAKSGRNILRWIIEGRHPLPRNHLLSFDPLPWEFIKSPAESNSLKKELAIAERELISSACQRGCSVCENIICKRRK